MLPIAPLQSIQTPPRRPTPKNTLRGRTDPLSSPAQTSRASPPSALARRSSLPGQGRIVARLAKLSLSAPARRSGGVRGEQDGGKGSLDGEVNAGSTGSAGLTSGIDLENVFPEFPFARSQPGGDTDSRTFPSTPASLFMASDKPSTQLTPPGSAFAPTSTVDQLSPSGSRFSESVGIASTADTPAQSAIEDRLFPTDAGSPASPNPFLGQENLPYDGSHALFSPADQTPSQSLSFSSSAFKFNSPLSTLSTPNTSFAFSPLALRPSQHKGGFRKISPVELDSDEEGVDDPPSPTGYVSPTSPFYSHPNEPVETLKWSFPPLHTESAISTPPGPLSPGQQADLRDSDDEADSKSDLGVEVELRFSERRKSSAFVEKSVPADEEEVEEDFACGGCGAVKKEAFVRLTPCGHLACPTCMNALVNAAAHKPPRAVNCFACSIRVQSFEPAVEAVKVENGGVGLVEALLKQYAEEMRAKEPVDADAASEAREQPRSTRRISFVRRRSPNAATDVFAGEARFLDESDADSAIASFDHSDVFSGFHLSDEEDGVDELESAAISPSALNILSPSTKPTGTNQIGVFGTYKPPKNQRIDRDAAQSGSAANLSSASPGFSSLKTRYNTDWPVVRLDNVPWSVTVKEIEAWLPQEKLLASDVDGDAKATLAVHLLANRIDGRTLNQAYLECASLAAAQLIVRACDGTYLGTRPVHLSLSSQNELLQTIFPNYSPGFDGLKPVLVRETGSSPIPLLLQSELTGLLELCKLQSAHSAKVPERPFFNIVTLLEKMPWQHHYSYNAAAIVRLFNTACAAIEILTLVTSRVPRWLHILQTLFDAIARCPVFRPTQVAKAAALAFAAGLRFSETHMPSAQTNLTFFNHKRHLRSKVAVTPARAPFGVTGVFDSFHATSTPPLDLANFTPSSLEQSCVSTSSAASAPLRRKSIVSSSASSTTSAPLDTSTPAKTLDTTSASLPRSRRSSSLADELGLDKSVVDSVAKALGIDLVK